MLNIANIRCALFTSYVRVQIISVVQCLETYSKLKIVFVKRERAFVLISETLEKENKFVIHCKTKPFFVSQPKYYSSSSNFL